ncbi:MAG: N-acetylmuramoyl-L-alanine amidase [Oscillospiraceae bacterium]
MFITIKWRSFVGAAAAFTAVCVLLTILGTIRTYRPVVTGTAAAVPGRVLIVDPGHGGLDGGAVGKNGTIESGINLDIGLKLRDLALLCGENVIMTRETENIDYPDPDASIGSKKKSEQKQRVALINSIPNATLISIHQNSFKAASSHGAQVFFRDTQESRTLAETLQSFLNNQLVPNSRRVAAPISDDIYLMRSIDCTAVLVECGFLSNPDECKLLNSESYRTKLALVLLSAWLGYN